MININLRSDEVLLLNEDLAYLDGKSGALLLTNKRIIWARKTAFGNKIKEMKELSLREIKVHNNDPQVRFSGDILTPELQIQHNRSIATIRFGTRKSATEWIKEIHREITGNEISSGSNKLGNFAISGAETLGKGIKDSVGAFASGLGVKGMLIKEKPVAAKCGACGAPISGIKGETVTYEFCGTKHVL